MNGNGGHQVALWAALTAFFTNLAALNLFALVGDESRPYAQAIVSLVTAVFVAISIYAKVRLDDAKEEKQRKAADRRQDY